MIRVLIADKNFLSRVGLELLVGELKGFELVPTVSGDKAALENQLFLPKPNLLIADFVSLGISIDEIKKMAKKFGHCKRKERFIQLLLFKIIWLLLRQPITTFIA